MNRMTRWRFTGAINGEFSRLRNYRVNPVYGSDRAGSRLRLVDTREDGIEARLPGWSH